MEDKIKKWETIGTVVGNTTVNKYSFVLRSHKARRGDIVATLTEVPNESGDIHKVIVWGTLDEIDRFNPFFPQEAAGEIAEEGIEWVDTILSGSRDEVHSQVRILGVTEMDYTKKIDISPLNYPVKPAESVLYPEKEAVSALLTGNLDKNANTIKVGRLISRKDVEVFMDADKIVSRHLAILAMTGAGKTVAVRRILRELISEKYSYPIIIFDPHGDYLGFYEKKDLFPKADIKLFYPIIQADEDNMDILYSLIEKLGIKFTDPQHAAFNWCLTQCPYETTDDTLLSYLGRLRDLAESVSRKREQSDPDIKGMSKSFGVVVRSLDTVRRKLIQMESNNERQRKKFTKFEFDPLPNVHKQPFKIIKPGQVSIFYLSGYDELTQSAIVSIVMESLFKHRSELNDKIPAFSAVIEEAHNFIPSRSEGTSEKPSLATVRKIITEGRKFGTGLILVSQRPSRLDETTLAQCNSFIVLRLVNPRDQNHIKQVMENLSNEDASWLPGFGPGQGLISGQAVKFPLKVLIDFDEDLTSASIGDEDFINSNKKWEPPLDEKLQEENKKNFSDVDDKIKRSKKKVSI